MKQNCWEIKQCGREPGGAKAHEMGVCVAAKDKTFDGINNGKYGGRVCWAVAGTLCGGKIQGSFTEKQLSCMSCDVYKQIKTEEGSQFVLKPQSQTTT